MRAVELRTHVEVDRPAAEVWSVVADYGYDPRWRAGVTTMAPSTAGTVEVGTTTAEELHLAGRTWHNDGVVTAVEEGSSFSWRTTAGAQAEGGRAVAPLGPGRCRVDLRVRVVPEGVPWLVRPLMTLLLRRGLREDGRRLRALVEGGETVQDGPRVTSTVP